MKTNIFKRLPMVFWTVQSFELMERGAYYTMMPILAAHAIWNVGVPVWLALILTVFMYPFQYGLPIFSGAYAEKFGYRRQMILAFSILFVAYLLLSFAFSSVTMVLAVVFLGLGIGTYKPLVSATVAKCTPQADRNFAYSIYYWIVNFAAFVFPILWVILEFTGIMDLSLYAWVFRIGSLFFLVNIIVAVFFFKEVPRSGQVKTVKDVSNNIATAFKDKKFVVMIFLIAGFWALYSVTLAPFQTIALGFKFLPWWFTLMLLGVFNPGTIILLGIPLAKMVEKMESLKALMAGVLIYLIGFSILALVGLTTNFIFIIIAIIMYSIGEFMVAPGYLAFVSKLAPKEKVSAYIGCNFLASFLGITGGALIFGMLANFVAVNLLRPYLFFGIVIAFGALILFGFMMYYHKWGHDIIERARMIQQMEEGITEDKIGEEPPGWTRIFNIFDKKSVKLIPMAIIPVILIGTFLMGTSTFYPPEDDEGGIKQPDPFVIDDFDIVAGPVDEWDGYLDERSEETHTFTFQPAEDQEGAKLSSISITVTWTDEDDIRRLVTTFENEGDNFAIEARYTADPGDSTTMNITESVPFVANTHGNQGIVTLDIDLDHSFAESNNGTGDWDIIIQCGECGDLRATRPAATMYNDVGNDYQVSIETEIFIPRE